MKQRLLPVLASVGMLSSIPLSPGQVSFDVKANEPDVTYEVKVVYENGSSFK